MVSGAAALRVREKRRVRFALALSRLREGRGLSQSAVSQWEAGTSTPTPDMIFQIEDDLELPAGRLSQLLGYLPLNGNGIETGDSLSAIEGDERLDSRGKRMLIAMYSELILP